MSGEAEWVLLARPGRRREQLPPAPDAAADALPAFRDVETGVRVRWRLKPMTGLVQAMVESKVRTVIAAVFAGADALEDYGFDKADVGLLGDIEVLAGLSVFVGCCAYAEALLVEWDLAEDGAPIALDLTPANIRRVLNIGAGQAGLPMLATFQRWLDEPAVRRSEEGEGYATSGPGAGVAD